MSENIYGCFMGNYKKRYRWQCKLFENVQDATEFYEEGVKNNGIANTLLVVVHPMTPNLMRPMAIQNAIKNAFQVDIVE
jgi:hypothetical protein